MKVWFPAKVWPAVRTFVAVVLAFAAVSAQGQTRPGSGAQEIAGAHRRVAQTQITGRRLALASLNGAQMFVGPLVDVQRPVPLIVHFHGVAWLIETHISRSAPHVALITVNLGVGSSVYGRPFEPENAFIELMNEAERELALRKGWSSITLTGFSAGYGAVRSILRHDRNFALVNNVLLLDGIHADYLPEGRGPAEGGAVDPPDVDAFVRFAAEAARGRKIFAITHSQIVPRTYASTTECADYLLEKLKLRRKAVSIDRPAGMRQLSRVDKKGFHVLGYAGDSAPDHVDHLHAMPEWFGLLGLKQKD
jgi:hypothetical protein